MLLEEDDEDEDEDELWELNPFWKLPWLFCEFREPPDAIMRAYYWVSPLAITGPMWFDPGYPFLT